MADWTCAICGKKPVQHNGEHKPQDPRGMSVNRISAGRREYLDSQEHKEAYARAAEEPGCLGHQAGAPGTCKGPLTPHHTGGRGANGGQKASERDFPVVMLCQWLNGAIESDSAVRRWAERTTFERDGVEYPFRISAAVARRLKIALETTDG